MVPNRDIFVAHAATDPSRPRCDLTVAIAKRRRLVNVGNCCGIVPRQGMKPVCETVVCRLEAILLSNQVAHAHAGDQLLPFQKPTQQ